MVFSGMAEDRYIKLNDDPIHEPLWKTFHLSASAQAGGLLTAFTAAANYNNPKQALIYLVAGIGAIAGLNILVRPIEKMSLKLRFRDFNEKLCIDTAPDEKTPPTKPDHMLASENSVLKSRKGMPWVGFLNAVNLMNYSAVAQNIIYGSDLGALNMFSTVYALSFLAHEVSCWNRFNQVVKENWVITDTPKKVEVKQEERAPVGLTPQPEAN